MLELKEKLKEQRVMYSPSTEEREKISQLNQLFEEARSQRDMTYRFLEDRDLESFIQDCKNRFTSYTTKRDKDWKARVFKPITRNRVLAIVAQLTASIIKPQFLAQNTEQEIDRNMSEIADDLYEYSTDKENFDKKFVLAVLQATVEGTVHVLDEYQNRTRTVKTITDMDWETGKVKYKEEDRKDFEGLYSSVVPNLEIYPGDIYTFEIQDQPYLFRRRLVPYARAMEQFQNYANWEYVRPGVVIDYDQQEDLFVEKENDDFDNDLVDIREYWCKQDDEYHIMIGGVLMTQYDNPIPYDHKMYPFAKSVFEPFDTEFYWGNSMVNKVKYEQDMVNKLYKMMLDKTYLSLFPPIITDDDRILKSNVFVPGVQVQGNPDRVSTMRDVIGTVGNSDVSLMNMVESSIDQSSVSQTTAGQQARSSQTATETLNAGRNAQVMLGLFGTFIGFLIQDFAKIRLLNIISFYPDIEEMDKITMVNKALATGLMGNKQMEFTDLGEMTEDQMISKSLELMEEEERAGGKKQKVLVDRKQFRNMHYFVKTVPVPEPKKTEALMRVLAGEEYTILAQNPFVDQLENTRELLRAYGKDETKFIKEQKPQEQVQPEQQAMQQGQQQGVGEVGGQMMQGVEAPQRTMEANLSKLL